MTEYKKLQIIKHALAHYIEREGADPADVETEKRLLAEIKEKVKWKQEQYRIEPKVCPVNGAPCNECKPGSPCVRDERASVQVREV